MRLDTLRVEWPAPPGVGALMSTRGGGASGGPFGSFNLGDQVGDDAAQVAANRRQVAEVIGATPCWLHQVHGKRVVDAASVLAMEPVRADASWTDQPGVACTVQVADCLPVLMAASNGRAVAAAHAGWRGMAVGVIEATLEAVRRAAACEAHEVLVWLGPCIGPREFEVGADVPAAFGPLGAPRFVPRTSIEGPARWLGDLPGLARDRLQRAGVRSVSGGTWCTVEDASRFFSFRRDRVTGRMAAAVWLRRP